jgi:FHA domain
VEPFPDLASLSDDDLKKLIDDLTHEEQEVSYRRRILHGKIDLLRAELQARLRETGGKSVLDQVDVDRLAEILAGKAGPECGFQNPEASNYCSKCGALLVKNEPGGETTMSFTPEDVADEASVTLDDLGTEGPALVVRSGGGRAGEHFVPEGELTTIGRSPDCDIFLDDVTVSRKHAAIVRKNGDLFIEDQGSLNGTFLNRKRIESALLENGDELQIGKYKLTFLEK